MFAAVDFRGSLVLGYFAAVEFRGSVNEAVLCCNLMKTRGYLGTRMVFCQGPREFG